MSIGRHNGITSTREHGVPKPTNKIPLLVIENDGFSLLQAELSALVWDLHVKDVTIHKICKAVLSHTKKLGLGATIRIRFALDTEIPRYEGAKVKSTIISVDLKQS